MQIRPWKTIGRHRGRLVVLALALTVAATASAEMLEKSGTFAGLEVHYRVILPDGYDPTRAYPTVLHFAGGPQTMDIVERSLAKDWQAGAERRAYVVISPATPNGELFFRGADRIFPEFLDYILAHYKVAGGKLQITGHSNGGLSAFHVAARYPDYFLSVTGYPGLLNAPNEAAYRPLKPLCIYMHVGGDDDGWRNAMRNEADWYRDHGYHVQFTVEPHQIHRLDTGRDNLDERLFQELGDARRGCG